MMSVNNMNNKATIFLVAFTVISLIGFLDFVYGKQLSFSLFYLLPISLLAYHRRITTTWVITFSIYAAILWFIADYSSNSYLSVYFAVWNAFVRLVIFNTIGFLIIYLKEKDKKLSENNEKLQKVNDEKNTMLGIAGHDLRNPMSTIYSFSDLLIDDYNDKLAPAVIETLSIIKNLSANTLQVLENLLDVSKIESGKVHLKLESQDYILFVKSQIFLNQILAKKKHIHIIFKTQYDRFIVDFDKHYLGEVLDNLLSNAIKYSFENSVVTVKITTIGNNKILTEVIDNGKGIYEKEQHRLFEYFQTTSTKPTSGEKTSGLGLAIAKRIVTLHHGEMGVKSVVNEGSNFFFVLPVENES